VYVVNSGDEHIINNLRALYTFSSKIYKPQRESTSGLKKSQKKIIKINKTNNLLISEHVGHFFFDSTKITIRN